MVRHHRPPASPAYIRPIAHLREFIRIIRQTRRDVRPPLGSVLPEPV